MATLTDALIRAAEPETRPRRLFDDKVRGLHVLIRPSGSKTWRLRTYVDGKETVRTLGNFPDLTLTRARAMASGVKTDDLTVTVADMTKTWLAATDPGRSEPTVRAIHSRIDHHVLPKLGDRPIALVRTAEIMDIVEDLRAKRKYETAKRVLQYLSQIFALACVKLDLQFNPAAEVLRIEQTSPPVAHRSAATPNQMGEVLDQLVDYRNRTTAHALEFLILTATRTSEVRLADWSEFRHLDDRDRAIWEIPAKRMKMKRAHEVPLSTWAVGLLRAQTGGGWSSQGWVFPEGGSPLSENTMLFALYRLGWKGKITVHGFRSTFSTAANEAGKPWDVIEAALAHQDPNAVRRAYNHAQFREAKRALMQWWGGEVARTRDVSSLI